MGTLFKVFRISFLLFFPIAQTKPTIVVTIYPLAALVEDLVGNAASVYSITPKGVFVHDYVVTSEDIEQTKNADAFIAIGSEEFLSQLTPPEGSLFILDYQSELRINSSRGPHGIRFYSYDLEKIVRIIADYLGKKFPRLNDTIRQNADSYIAKLHSFESSIADLPKGSIVASFPLIAYMCLSLNVTPLGPIMPGEKRVSSDRPIVSFIESKGTPIDDAIRGIAKENGVPVFYVEAFSDDPLSELIKASSIILGASVADYYLPSGESSQAAYDYIVISLLILCLLYIAITDIYASRARRRKGS